MPRYAEVHHILLPLDGSTLSERALPFAALLARTFDASVTLLRVLDTRDGTEREVDALEWEMFRIEARGKLARARESLAAAGVVAQAEIVEGRAAEQILRYAVQHEADLIVLTSHGQGGLSGWTLSSTAQKVIARAQTSILIVPAYVEEAKTLGELRLNKILLPLDCSCRSECILTLAARLARAANAELILAHVVPEPELPRRLAPSADDLELAAKLTERNLGEATRYLNEVGNELCAQGARARVRALVSQRRAASIRRLSEEENVDLVLLSAHGSTGDSSERYGQIAARFIQEASKPTLIVQDLAGQLSESVAERAARNYPGH